MFVWMAMTVAMVGWDYQGIEPPAVIVISFARSEVHKTARIVDDILGGSSAIRQPECCPHNRDAQKKRGKSRPGVNGKTWKIG